MRWCRATRTCTDMECQVEMSEQQHGRRSSAEQQGMDEDETSPPKRTTTDRAAPVMVPIETLTPADSPRLHGEDPDHIRLLAEATSPLPPILVRRSTMRV